MKETKSRKRIIIISAVLLLLICGWWALSVYIYNNNFNRRFESYEPLMLHAEDFDGLQRTKHMFPSNQGQMLTGYMYRSGDNQRGIVVMAHGFGGGGHNSYMDCANYFARHGYCVFAYDATGNDESEGKGVGGLPQGVIDLDYAVSFVEESGIFPDLPIVLFGHSWGGYSVCSVLTYHPEVKAVIECSGFNSSSDLIEAGGKKLAGNFVYAMMPFIKIHELIKFGKCAANTAMDGFKNSGSDVMVVHSADDDLVPIEYGYDKYYAEYKDNPRFVFIRFENKGHNDILNDPDNTYKDQFNEGFDKWIAALDYDCRADANKDRFIKDKADYIHRHIDRAEWADRLDADLFDKFISFYDEHTAG
ncbi:MAG: alpha/beta hydrolase [Clostridiales bacterium]|nr:alpha/beta hydrolase [Clostridiales bacterium]